MHKAKRMLPGWYQYRGWEIDRINNHWSMRPIGDAFWTDSTETLREAKILIDGYLED